MKFAIIAKEAFQQFTQGQVLKVYESDASEEGKGVHSSYLNGGEFGPCVHIEVPEGVNAETHKAIMVAEKWTKEGEADVFENPNDETWTHVPAHWELQEDADLLAAWTAKDKAAQISERYADMEQDIYDQLEAATGTRNPATATAQYESWKVMSAKPSLFHSQGLLAEIAVGSFSKGDALDTIQKVEDYANACIAAVEAYGVYRLTRRKQFAEEKAVIEGA